MNKEAWHDTLHKVWPSTKKELEKAIVKAKDLMNKGEEHFKVFSEKSAKNVKKLSINVKKEKIYYNLGKIVAETPKSKWSKNEKVSKYMIEVKKLNKELKDI